MDQRDENEQVREFIKRYSTIRIQSTDVDIVNYSGDLYNVSGSTKDPTEIPDYKGATWKKLLVEHAGLEEAECYVTNATADDGSTHPRFLVGGHMTPDPKGHVARGDVSYLMPLCKWHNSTRRNGVSFEHTEKRMLKLYGFMEGDTLLTFAMRLPAAESHTLLYFDNAKGCWEYRHVSNEFTQGFAARVSLAALDGVSEPEYAIFERTEDVFFLTDVRLNVDR